MDLAEQRLLVTLKQQGGYSGSVIYEERKHGKLQKKRRGRGRKGKGRERKDQGRAGRRP